LINIFGRFGGQPSNQETNVIRCSSVIITIKSVKTILRKLLKTFIGFYRKVLISAVKCIVRSIFFQLETWQKNIFFIFIKFKYKKHFNQHSFCVHSQHISM